MTYTAFYGLQRVAVGTEIDLVRILKKRRQGQILVFDDSTGAQIDLDLMDCVKAAMSRWSFSRPRGGAIHVERPFTFRRAP